MQLSLVAQPVISTTWKAEAGGLQIQGQPELQSKFKSSPGNLSRTCLKIKRELGCISECLPIITRPFSSTPSNRKESKVTPIPNNTM